MKKQMTYWSAVLVLMALPLLQGCSDDFTGPDGRNPGVTVDRLVLSPGTLEIQVGAQVQMNAKMDDQDIAPRAVEWVSSAPGVAAVSEDGLVEGLATGVVIITAEYQGTFGTAQVRVATGGGKAGKGNEEDERER